MRDLRRDDVNAGCGFRSHNQAIRYLTRLDEFDEMKAEVLRWASLTHAACGLFVRFVFVNADLQAKRMEV